MKKWLIILFTMISVSFLHCVKIDYGASIDSYGGMNFEDFGDITGSTEPFGFEKLSIYSSFEFSNGYSLAVDGYYKFLYSYDSDLDYSHIFDFNTLVLAIPLKSTNLMVGRNSFSDVSGDILSHNLDGIAAAFPFDWGVVLFNAGYTGLLNYDDATLFTTSDDDWNISRIVEGADVVKAFEEISVWGSLYSIQDTNNLDSNLFIYGGGGVRGSVGSSFFYSVRGNLQTGLYDSAFIFAGMGATSFTWYLDSDNQKFRKLSPYLSFDMGVSSGDSDLSSTSLETGQDISDGVNLYTPMVTGGPGTIYSVDNQNLTYFKVIGSISPRSFLQTQLGSVVYLRTVEGVTSTTSSASSDDGRYMGTEFSFTVNLRPMSDLGFALSGGVFIPDGSIITDDPYGLATAYISLSL